MSATRQSGLKRRDPDRGFALITALLAVMILLALGYLALNVSTGDLRISARLVGEKKALATAEAGIYTMMQTFDPAITPSSAYQQVDAAADPASRYKIGDVGPETSGPPSLPLTGYAISGGQQWGQTRHKAVVTGENTDYSSSAQIKVGFGYGPTEITTMYR